MGGVVEGIGQKLELLVSGLEKAGGAVFSWTGGLDRDTGDGRDGGLRVGNSKKRCAIRKLMICIGKGFRYLL